MPLLNVINGNSAANVLHGTAADDKISGLGGNDTISGLGGNDQLFGGAGNDLLKGGAGFDLLSGDAGDDILVGSSGEDTLRGGSGFDTADYSDIGTAVTLRSGGVVAKGSKGVDQLGSFDVAAGTIEVIERVIGATGKRNLIDGTSVVGAVNINVDLAAENFSSTIVAATGGFALGTTFGFKVVNFRDVRGSINSDVIKGDSLGNVFDGSRGNDTYDGRGGSDTIDYSFLNQGVTLNAAGVIRKGAFGTDTIQNVEKIIGAIGATNVIDGTVPGGSITTAFDIDLAASKLIVKNIPNVGNRTFTVTNFSQVIGTSNADVIRGDDGGNLFVGSRGNDTLQGRGGFDTADYSGLGAKITLKAGGVLVKSGLGTDTLGAFNVGAGTIEVFERVIGASGFANVLDNSQPGPVSVNVDLQAETITATVISAFGGFASGTSFGFQVVNFRDVIGSGNTDTIRGDGADNTFTGSTGNDVYDGRGGFDTVDYGAFGSVITLKAGGAIEKQFGGTDSIVGIDRVLSATGQRNVIDGSVPNGVNLLTSLVVDLATKSLVVKDIPGIGDATFTVENFVDVRGTSNADVIRGDAGNNTFFGSRGNDILQGRGGFDVVDYSGLGVGVTLKTGGRVDKGALGTDTLGTFDTAAGSIETFERVIGAAGAVRNVIDGTSVFGAVNVEVDLETQGFVSRVVSPAGTGFPLNAAFGFRVENFIDVKGTNNNDIILGDFKDNVFFGSLGNDTLLGRQGFDVANYSGLGAKVTLAAGGLLTKDGGLGVDTLGSFNVAAGTIETFERVIGATGFANVLDNSAPGPIAVDVDLQAQTIEATVLSQVGGFAPGTTFGFQVVNFRDVIGSLNDDEIRGDAAANTFTGSAGNDILQGRGGFDIVDYSNLGAKVTLAAGGLLTKAGLGVDSLGSFNVVAGTIETFERVIGDASFANVLDSSAPGPVAVAIDLVQETIEATVLTAFGGFAAGTTFGFEVVNFVDAIGSSNADSFKGDDQNNTFTGNAGNDTILFDFFGNGSFDTFTDFDLNDFVVFQDGFDELAGEFRSGSEILDIVQNQGGVITDGVDEIEFVQVGGNLSARFNGTQFAVLDIEFSV